MSMSNEEVARWLSSPEVKKLFRQAAFGPLADRVIGLRMLLRGIARERDDCETFITELEEEGYPADQGIRSLHVLEQTASNAITLSLASILEGGFKWWFEEVQEALPHLDFESVSLGQRAQPRGPRWGFRQKCQADLKTLAVEDCFPSDFVDRLEPLWKLRNAFSHSTFRWSEKDEKYVGEKMNGEVWVSPNEGETGFVSMEYFEDILLFVGACSSGMDSAMRRLRKPDKPRS